MNIPSFIDSLLNHWFCWLLLLLGWMNEYLLVEEDRRPYDYYIHIQIHTRTRMLSHNHQRQRLE